MFFFNHARRDALRPRSLDEGRVLNFKRQIDAYLALPLDQQLQTDIPPVWKYEFQPDVIENLTELSYGKCPFCEQTELRLQPYRFRPPAYATPAKTREDRLCYLWKAFEWENLFPICGECTPEDKSYFPVKGRRTSPPSSLPGLTFAADEVLAVQEDALLVYPGELLMPDENFQIRTDGTWIARTERSAETIKNFNLNRPSLVRRRSHAIESQINALRNKRIFWNEKSSSFEGVTLGSTRYLFLWNLISQFPNYFVNLFEITSSDVESILEQWMESDGFKLVLEEVLQTYDLRLSSSSTPSRPDKSAPNSAPLPPRPSFGETMVPAESRSSVVITAPKPQNPKPPTPKTDLNHARLIEVGIKQFKSLEAITFKLPAELANDVRVRALEENAGEIPTAPCILILGENATGKSSILEAIALTCISDDMRKRLKLDPTQLITNSEFMGKKNGRELSASRVDLRFEDGKRLTLDISAESGSHKLEVTREGGEDNRLPQVFAYGAHRLYGKKRRDLAIRNIDTLFKDDQHISNPEPWLVELSKKNPDALNEVVAALRHIIQIDGEFKTIEVKNGECVINIEKKRKGDSSYIWQQKLDLSSSGYKAVLAVLCDIFRTLLQQTPNKNARDARKGKPIILIDEIEAHLHPRWKLQIVSGLRRALPNATFILTSHDPLCVRGTYPGEVMMLNRYQNEDDDDDKLPEVVEQVSDFKDIGTMTIEQLLTSDLFQLFTTDDRQVEIRFANIATLLSRKNAGEDLRDDEKATLKKFQTEIAQSLPYGRTQVSMLVQEAVAEYLSKRRQVDEGRRSELRQKAIDSIHDFLRGELP